MKAAVAANITRQAHFSIVDGIYDKIAEAARLGQWSTAVDGVDGALDDIEGILIEDGFQVDCLTIGQGDGHSTYQLRIGWDV